MTCSTHVSTAHAGRGRILAFSKSITHAGNSACNGCFSRPPAKRLAGIHVQILREELGPLEVPNLFATSYLGPHIGRDHLSASLVLDGEQYAVRHRRSYRFQTHTSSYASRICARDGSLRGAVCKQLTITEYSLSITSRHIAFRLYLLGGAPALSRRPAHGPLVFEFSFAPLSRPDPV